MHLYFSIKYNIKMLMQRKKFYLKVKENMMQFTHQNHQALYLPYQLLDQEAYLLLIDSS